MKKFGLLGTSALLGSLAFAGPAFAQDTDAAADQCTPEQAQAGTCTLDSGAEAQGTEGTGEQSVLVTGSRIRRPNLESTVPITSLGGEQIFQQGDTNVGETLNELPQLRSTFAQQNPGLGIGIGGLNLLDLRGLGTQRTLVLVNGRRHVPADILNNAVSPDINTIPNDLIERVDIVTGGNSAIYGSDAIAGVVNFILRRDFEGLQVRGAAATTEAGFGSNQYTSIMYGMNFADGQGNVTVHGEYARQERVFASDVPWFRQNNGFGVVDADSGGLDCNQDGFVDNCDGFPDRIFLRDIRSASINVRGLIPITQASDNTTTPGLSPTGRCGNGIAANNTGTSPFANNPAANAGHGTAYNCTFIFSPEGRLVEQTGARFGAGIIGGIIGGNGQTGREGAILSVLPFLERYNFNMLAHYTFSDAFELFAEAKWNRVNALGNNAGPSFIQGTFGQFDLRERVRLDNPFLHPNDLAVLRSSILTSGCNTSLTVACFPHDPTTRVTFGGQGVGGPLNAADIAAINAGTYRFVISRLLTDAGIRDEKFQRDTWRVVLGLRGTFNEDWNYELSANRGRFREDITTFGFVDRQRFMLALDAGRDPVTGAIRCRSQFDATAATPFPNNAANVARLAADIAACVPYNPFGAGDNEASRNYFGVNATNSSGLDQFIASGFVSGDLSQLFELPGGPVRFALGVEYRRETAFYDQDNFITDGFTNSVVIPDFRPDAFIVKEAFAELQIPIFRDMPFFHELTLSGAARVAKYQGDVGTVWSYNAGIDWSPIRDVRFRGNYSRAVRAPNVSETAFPLVPNFAPGFNDPCAPNQINTGTATRSANCIADLMGATLPNVTYSLPIVSGSNPGLNEETSDSWTFGAVIQPRFLPGFSLSIDYYDITVNDIITALTAQAIANNCYDQPTLANVFCAQFTRWRGPGVGPFGEQVGAILGNSLIAAPLNFAKRERVGIDFNLNYRTNILEDVRLNTNLIYTHNIKISNFQNPTLPDFENRILGELGDPVDEFRLDIDLTHGPFTLGYRLRYIGPMWVNAYEDFNYLPSACSTPVSCPPGDLDWADIRKYPSVTYSDLRFEWNIAGGAGIADDLRFYFGVDNVFDRRPPLGTTATGVGSAIYEFRGRNYYAGFRARF